MIRWTIDEKLQCNIDREAAKISALSSGKIDKYEHLAGEELLPPDQRRVTDQDKFAYPPLRKTFEKQTKTNEEQGKKTRQNYKSFNGRGATISWCTFSEKY